MLTSTLVTAEDAVLFTEDNRDAVVALAGELADVTGPVLRVRAATGRWMDVLPGQYVILYGPRDLGVMDDGEYRRWFPDAPSQ